MTNDDTGAPPPPEPEGPIPGPDERSSGQPPWVIPVIVGIVAVTIIAVVLILSRGDDDDDGIAGDTTAVDTSLDTTLADTTVVETTIPETTVVDTTTTTTEATTTTTIAPETTTTVAPSTTVESPPPTTAAGGPEPISALTPNQASIADGEGVRRYAIANTCSSTATVGLQVESSVLIGESGDVYVLDVYFDEGIGPSVALTDMNVEIAGFVFGQDTFETTTVWSADLPGSADAIDRLEMPPIEGSRGPVTITVNRGGVAACSTGFYAEPSPIPPGEPITPVGQFDAPIPGNGFALLAECGGAYVLSGSGLLDLFDEGATFSSTIIPAAGGDTAYRTIDDPGPNDQFIEQFGGGGDIEYASRVVDFDGNEGYLTFVLPPTVAGGLPSIECSP